MASSWWPVPLTMLTHLLSKLWLGQLGANCLFNVNKIPKPPDWPVLTINIKITCLKFVMVFPIIKHNMTRFISLVKTMWEPGLGVSFPWFCVFRIWLLSLFYVIISSNKETEGWPRRIYTIQFVWLRLIESLESRYSKKHWFLNIFKRCFM